MASKRSLLSLLVIVFVLIAIFGYALYSNQIGKGGKSRLKSHQAWFTVVDDETGLPIRNAEVNICRVDRRGGEARLDYYMDGLRMGDQQETDARGMAKFMLAPDEYAFFIFPREPYARVFFPRNMFSVGMPDNVEIKVRLKKGAEIRGRYADIMGRPFDYKKHRVRAALYYLHDDDMQTSGAAVSNVGIDNNGNFTINQLWPARYKLRFSGENVVKPSKEIELRVNDYGEVVTNDFLFDISKTVTIQVLSLAEKKALKEVAVFMVNSERGGEWLGHTDEKGELVFYGVEGGDVSILITYFGISWDDKINVGLDEFKRNIVETNVKCLIAPGNKYQFHVDLSGVKK